jgi:hypothetical protein
VSAASVADDSTLSIGQTVRIADSQFGGLRDLNLGFDLRNIFIGRGVSGCGVSFQLAAIFTTRQAGSLPHFRTLQTPIAMLFRIRHRAAG